MQSLRQWYKRFDTFVIDNDYRRHKYDNYVSHKELFDDYFIYLLLYVDDVLIDFKNMLEINRLKLNLEECLKLIKDLRLRRKY